ncbi:MAG: radical SAM protein [Actinobacteria bacterium]|nr:MAG: radical SAM protein [Actinomycetota bacterium]
MEGLDSLRLKAELLVEGVRATGSALAEVGTAHKEQNHGLFGWDFEDHPDKALPDDFLLPDGTVVQFRQSGRSRYVVDVEGGRPVLSDLGPVLSDLGPVLSHHGPVLSDRGPAPSGGGRTVCKVEWLPRPSFYSETTSAGNKMVSIGQVGGEDCLFFCYHNYCSHFARGRQCLFCNLVSTSRTYDSVLKRKDIDEIGEVAATGFGYESVRHVLLTGGCFKHEAEIELVRSILGSIARRAGLDRIPGTVLPSPAKTREEIRAYHDAGIGAIGFSMEIWDEGLYRAICPGKAETTSHDQFLESIETAVDVFGAGNVYGVLVMGLEPRDTFLEGVRTLTGLGANVVPFVWSPNPGSRLEGHRAPSASWYVDTIVEAADIVVAGAIPSGVENHCYKCDGNSLLHDALRLKGIQ